MHTDTNLARASSVSECIDPARPPAGGPEPPRWLRVPVSWIVAGLVVFLVASQAHALWNARGLTDVGWDDEGYVMISLRAFARGARLYDDVYTQYGPAFFLLFGLPMRWLGFELDHDWSRAVTAIEIFVIGALVAGSVWRLTRSGLAVAITIVVLRPILHHFYVEPLHPHGLCWVLTAAVVFLGSQPVEKLRPGVLLAMGALVGVLALIKVNVGVIVFTGVIAGLLGGRALRFRGNLAWWAAWVGLCAVPVALLRSELGRWEARTLVVTVVGVVVGRAFTSSAVAHDERAPEHAFMRFGGAALAAALVVVAVILVCGTSLLGLWWGVVGQHVALLVSTYPPDFGAHALATQSAGVVLAVLWCIAHRVRRHVADVLATCMALTLGVVTSSILCSGEHWLTMFPRLATWSLPFAWVVLACPRPTTTSTGRATTPWVLSGVAAFEVLQCYPVFGTQLAWVVLLLGPLAAIALQRSTSVIAHWIATTRWSSSRAEGLAPRVATLAWGTAGVVAAAWLLVVNAEQSASAREEVSKRVPLNLHGARSLSAFEADAACLRWISDTARVAGAFYSLPAQNSVYFWSETEPLTDLNFTFRPDLLRKREIREIKAALKAAPRWFVALDSEHADYVTGSPDPYDTLPLYLHRECVPLGRWRGIHTFVRRGNAPVWISCARVEGGAVVLRTGCAVDGAVAAVEVRSMATMELIGRAAMTAADEFDLVGEEGASLALPSTTAFAAPTTVRLVPRKIDLSTAVGDRDGLAVRLVGEGASYVQTFPLITR